MGVIEEEIEARSAHEVLAWSRHLVNPALRAAVDTMPASIRHIAGYHFGWWDEHGRPAGAGGGKALRPALTLLAAEAVGSAPAAAMPAAVAVELVHNFSLLHDDVMDGDLTRRHRPTAWSVFGTDVAIMAGDALLTLAFDVLAAGDPASDVREASAIAEPVEGRRSERSDRISRDGLRMLSAAVLDLVDGQNVDKAFEERRDVDLPACMSMSAEKTGALLGCACALGALFGGGGSEQVTFLRGFGEQLGLAFQFIDDLLGIWGDPSVTGKPVYSDLRNRKKSLPVVAALTSDTPAGRELAALYYRDQPLSPADLVHAAALIDHAGGRAWSQSQADELLARSLRHLWSAGPAARAAGELSALARLVTNRDH